MTLSPLNKRRLDNFKSNKRGWYSFLIFTLLFLASIFADFLANEKPLLIKYENQIYLPIINKYAETTFGGDFETEADYRDPYVKNLINNNGWMIWPIIPYSYDTIIRDLAVPAPAPPSKKNWLGTDDQARDVLARLIYGFRISILFGFTLTFFSMLIGVSAGAIQGYFGGKIDLFFQRFMEIWSAIPTLYVLIILASIVQPNFWWLLAILLLFSWMGYVGVVRAEFLRARNLDYVRAARALGVSNYKIMFRHLLPNATVATITFLPFSLSASVTALSGLDFLGFGLPPGSASLGEMVNQGRNNLQAPWLGLTSFFTLGLMLGLLVFVGEAIRDALDPRKTFV
ncbi:MAG: ABC transporter permease [Pelagibacteraceae bacterium]|jgi:microcin C transport system permease protein|nr:ABC transporter permease [Pelagibacteraceae bacterium]MDP6784859.1 ABC transporter permease [Alphaproteobacteria bacterium]MBO6466867.1 ABC transporter permease [Pelagibacteraceae bacterium]MBO6467320.1 ABC transporter permease [Pelagibacteraceae bacterium]MBO6469112.1 ABC transporter permease [Pelagibacteraceae bacterium]